MRNILFALIAIATTGCTDFLAGYATVEDWEENHRVEAVVVTPPSHEDVTPPSHEDEDTGDVDTDTGDTTEDTMVDTDTTEDTTVDTDVDCIHIMMIKHFDDLTITMVGDHSDGFLEFWVDSYSDHQSEPWAVVDGHAVIPLDEFQESDPFTHVNFTYRSEVVTNTVVWGPNPGFGIGILIDPTSCL